MKRIKKFAVLGLATALTASFTLSVSAAGLKDVFQAKYYADSYADLKAAFGYDEDALYKHFLTYGLKEGRSASIVFDVAKYRELYGDLDAAFGDNWDAYVNHYFTYGANEKRDCGALFDPVAYAEAYPDIKAAFGNDTEAIINHYLTYGIKEGRTAGVTIVDKSSDTGSSSGGSSGSSESGTPSTSTPEPGAPSTPTPEPPAEVLATVYLYGNVEWDDENDKITALHEATPIEITEGSGTVGAPYKANLTGIKRNTRFDGNYWYTVAAQPKDGANDYQYGDVDVSDHKVTLGEGQSLEDGCIGINLGDDGAGGSTTVLLGGVYYEFNVSFEDASPVRVISVSNADEGKLTFGSSKSSNPTTGTGYSDTQAFKIEIDTVSAAKYGRSGEADIYWFAIDLPVAESKNQYWVKINGSWTNVTTHGMSLEGMSDGRMTYGIGVAFDENDSNEAVVELCMGTEASPAAGNAIFYKVIINEVERVPVSEN